MCKNSSAKLGGEIGPGIPPDLDEKTKLTESIGSSLKVYEVVPVHKNFNQCGICPLRRVEEASSGRHGINRKVKAKTAYGTFVNPVSLVFLLTGYLLFKQRELHFFLHFIL